MWANFTLRFNKLKDLLHKAEFRRSALQLVDRDFTDSDIKISEIKGTIQWVDGPFEKALKEVRTVLKLLPEVVWQQYALHEIEGLREQVMLAKASRIARKIWTQRPRLLKKTYKHGKKAKKKIQKETEPKRHRKAVKRRK